MDIISGLTVFVNVAQTKSFAETARLLGITPSAVSKSITRLEKRINVRLFQRSTRSIHLTSEGEVFLNRCQRILNEIQAAENELSTLTEVPRGKLKVGLAYAGGLPLPLISEFMQHYPDIQLDLDFSDRLTDLIDEGFDVIIRGSELKDSRLKSKCIGQYRKCLVASPTYLKERGYLQAPEDLIKHQCLHYRYPTSGKLDQWNLQLSVGEVISSLPTVACNSLDALLYMAKQGHGIACVPDFSVQHALKEGSLELVLTQCDQQLEYFYIVWTNSQQLPPKIRVFIDFMAEKFHTGLVNN